MSEIKNIPRLRFPEFKEDYQKTELGKISNFISKGTTPKKFDVKGVNFVKIESLNGINIIEEKCTYISENIHFNDLKRSILEEDDILFAIAGATIGKIGVVRKNMLPANTNQALSIIRLKEKKSLPYIIQVLESKTMKKYIQINLSVGAQPNLSLKQISDFQFNLPSLPEQQKIADFLTAVDQRIELLEKKKTLLETYKKGVMKKIFNQEIRFKDDNGNDFPDWEEKRLDEISKIYQPKTISQNQFTENGYVVYGANGPIGFYSEYNHETPQVVVTCRGNSCGTVNITTSKSWITGNGMVVNVDDSPKVSKNFIYFYLLNDNLTYLVTGSGQPQITGDLKNHKINLPTEIEQIKISEFLSAIDSQIELLKSQIDKSRTWKKGLLQKMFV